MPDATSIQDGNFVTLIQNVLLFASKCLEKLGQLEYISAMHTTYILLLLLDDFYYVHDVLLYHIVCMYVLL